MRILIVDDELDARESLRMLLEVYGHLEVLTAKSAIHAKRILSSMEASDHVSTVDVILTDVSMPGMTGIEFCRHVKASTQLHHIPVLVLTGQANETVLQEAFEAGAHDFLPKGVGSIELLARLRSAMNLKKEIDQRMTRERELLDITRRLERLNEKLRRLSLIDELSGTPNRRFFNLLLRREWKRAVRDAVPLSLIMLDVDWFKSYNDQYGHPAGDVCLTKVASTLAGLIRRPGDVAARYGGEEFIVLLSNTGLEGAAVVAESLRAGVESLKLEHLESPFGQVTISAGVASTIPGGDVAPTSLLQAADQSLYRAKSAGRNKVDKNDGLFKSRTN